MHDRAGLEIANIVRRVVYQLHMPDAPIMSFLEPFELRLEKIEPLDICDDGGLSRLVRGLEIRGGQGPTQAMAGDHLIHPSKTLKMVPV
jgi:hypothetical protein